MFRLWFSFKYKRRTNFLLVGIFENAPKKVVDCQLRHLGHFCRLTWPLVTWPVLTDKKKFPHSTLIQGYFVVSEKHPGYFSFNKILDNSWFYLWHSLCWGNGISRLPSGNLSCEKLCSLSAEARIKKISSSDWIVFKDKKGLPTYSIKSKLCDIIQSTEPLFFPSLGRGHNIQ